MLVDDVEADDRKDENTKAQTNHQNGPGQFFVLARFPVDILNGRLAGTEKIMNKLARFDNAKIVKASFKQPSFRSILCKSCIGS